MHAQPVPRLRNVGGRPWSRDIARAAVGLSLAPCVLLRIWSPGRIGIGQGEAQFLSVSALPSVRGVSSFVYAHESHPPLLYLIARRCQVVGLPMVGVMSPLVLLASVGTIAAV